MTVLEALGCGLPCLIADSPKSATKQIALSDEWLYRYDSVDALAEKIDSWVDRPAALAAARADSLRMAARYRIESSVEKLERVYEDLLPSHSIAGNAVKSAIIANRNAAEVTSPN
jgi:glycosyltransferase involved in cell wall biosynthesis